MDLTMDDIDTLTPREHPQHINPNCPCCDTELVPSDSFRYPMIPEEHIRWDRWECSLCYFRDFPSLYYDWPVEARGLVDMLTWLQSTACLPSFRAS